MDEQLVALAGDWALQRDFAVRSAGFPVQGLDVFGEEDEEQGLRAVAEDAAFQEAVTWQNRMALKSGVLKLASGARESAVRSRRHADIVASYWQRYCSKNDTIGFFGPLAWGRIVDEGPALSARSGALIKERAVHIESWAVQALAESIDRELPVPMGVVPEQDLRRRLLRLPDSEARGRGLAALERLEAARQAVAGADRADLPEALDAFDRVFRGLTGREPVRGEQDRGGGRSPIYLDCMRDLDVKIGPGLMSELSVALPALLASSRWHCGRVYELGRERLAALVGNGPPRPLAPLASQLFRTGWDLVDELGDQVVELQRRWAALLEGTSDTLAARATQAFSDFRPAWPMSVYHSFDIQIAAADIAAVDRGEFLVVLGDFHAGGNPLGQALFANVHPHREQFFADHAADLGGQQVMLMPPSNGPATMTARLYPAVTQPTDIHIVADRLSPMPEGHRVVRIEDLLLEGDRVTDRERSFQAPLVEVFFMPIFASAIRTFDPFGGPGHLPRLTVGRTVLRRARWSEPVGQVPAQPADIPGWARSRGMPRRAFARSPIERKPIFVDFESPALMRVLARFLRPAVEQSRDALVQFTEMLPGPRDCWLQGDAGRYTSELRLVAVDLPRRSAARLGR